VISLSIAPTIPQKSEPLDNKTLSIALVGPEGAMRDAISSVLSKAHSGPCKVFSTYPPMGELTRFLKQQFDLIILGLDDNPALVLQLIESICASGNETVFVYSAHFSPDKMMHCMRAGVREYLTQDLTVPMLEEALGRIHSRKTLSIREKKTKGKLFSFVGSKGGVGTTTLAVNFAVVLASEADSKTLLIDLNLPLGDAALNLGVNAQYSTLDALQNYTRLDANLLSSLLTKHASGLSILSAPSQFAQSSLSAEAIERLMVVARDEFDYIVVDLGTRPDVRGTVLFAESSTIYLVAQPGISELRNANRILTEFFSAGGPKIEIVLNRATARTFGIEEAHIAKALGRPVQWKVPDDYSVVKKSQNAATAIVSNESSISQTVRQMANTAISKPAKPAKKKYLNSLFSSKS
jgi:pilus assembly protein CpaE